jgi:hypothetical protein
LAHDGFICIVIMASSVQQKTVNLATSVHDGFICLVIIASSLGSETISLGCVIHCILFISHQSRRKLVNTVISDGISSLKIQLVSNFQSRIKASN